MERVKLSSVALLLATSACAPLGSGCANNCETVKKDYDAALAAEQAFASAPSDDAPIHFGIAVRDALLNEVVDRAMRVGLEKALTFSESLSLATGQKIGLSTDGDVADLGLYPDKACEKCLRVDGRLGGNLTVKLPILGSQRVPLAGTFSVVAPIAFGQTDDGRASVQLDLSQAAKLAKSKVTPKVQQLPPTWWKVIEAPLSKRMADAITSDLPNITLFTFKGFDFGIEGLDVKPVSLVSDHSRGVVFAGFTTNLAAEGAALQPRTDLGKNDDVAVGIDRRLLGAMTMALLNGGKLSRTWTKDGKESSGGPISITAPSVELPETADGPQGYALNFRAWQMPTAGQCWWADTRIGGTVETGDGGELKVAIDEAKIMESSMPGVFKSVANWKASRIISKSSEVVTKTLTPKSVDLAGSSVALEKSALSLSGNGAWLTGSVAVAEAEEKK